MKKTINLFGMLVAVALALVSCAKEQDVNNASEKVYTHSAIVTLGKEDITKTAVVENGAKASYVWTAGDQQYIHVYENNVEGTITGASYSDDFKTVTLAVSFEGTPTAPYTYKATYAKELAPSSNNPYVQATQNAVNGSFDPAADVLISEAISSENTPLTSLTFTMGRAVTVNKMTLTGLEDGELVSKVELSFTKGVVGGVYAIGTGNHSSSGKTITVNYETPVAATSEGSFPVYFISAPVEDTGFTSVVVSTDKNVYTKSSITGTITFAVGKMKSFTMAMAGTGAPISNDVDYTLVTAVSGLPTEGNQADIIIVNGTNAMAGQSTNNRGKVTVPAAVNGVITLNNTSTAHIFTLAHTENGYLISDNADGQYLYDAGTSSNNHLKSSESIIASCYWNLSYENEVLTIENANNTAKPYLQYNSSSSCFSCYKSGQAAVQIYLNTASVKAIPVDNRPVVTLSFSSANPAAIHLGDDFTEPTLTKDPANTPVTYSATTDPASIATIDPSTGELTITGAGTITVTATVSDEENYKPASASYTLTVNPAIVNHGSVDNPVSISDVVDVIDNLSDGETTTDFYYVGGIVSAASTGIWSGKLTFSFTDNTNVIKAYNCLGLNGNSFSSKDDVALGDNVVVYGNLQKYVNNNTVTYEVVNGQLAKLEEAPYFNASLSSNSIAAEGGDLTLTIDSNTSWTVAVSGSASLSKDSGSNDDTVTITIPQNNNGATYTLSFTADGISPDPSDLTITQNAYVEMTTATATFTAAKSGGMTAAATGNVTSGTRRNVTANITSGGKTNSDIRVYKNATLTLSVPSGAFITGIAFTGTSSNPVSGFASQAGFSTSGDNGSWSGSAQSVSFEATGAQVRLTQIEVTYSIATSQLANYTPVINVTSDNPMSVANTAGSASITYTIDDAPNGAVLTNVTNNANWITNVNYSTSGTVSFNVAAQEEDAEARSATLTLKYTDAVDVSVTVNQAAGPSSSGGSDKTYTITWNSTNNSQGVSSYSNTWSVTADGLKCNMSNWNNNNNGWSCVKTGSKNGAVTATIITDTAIQEAIKTVTLTIGATRTNVTSIKLYVSDSTSFGSTADATFTNETGDQTVTLSPASNKYYKIEVVCTKYSANGFFELDKLVFSTK